MYMYNFMQVWISYTTYNNTDQENFNKTFQQTSTSIKNEYVRQKKLNKRIGFRAQLHDAALINFIAIGKHEITQFLILS